MHLALGAGCAALALLLGRVGRSPRRRLPPHRSSSSSGRPRRVTPPRSSAARVPPPSRRACGSTGSRAMRRRRCCPGSAPATRSASRRRTPSPERMSVTDFTDPLVGTEWWRAAIGVAGLTPPGPGKPITIVDSGVDVAHPEFAGRSSIVTLNAQEPEPLGGVHGTAVASLIGAPADDVGMVGIYPRGAAPDVGCRARRGHRAADERHRRGRSRRRQPRPRRDQPEPRRGAVRPRRSSRRSRRRSARACSSSPRRGTTATSAARSRSLPACPTCSPRLRPIEQNQVTSFSSRSRFVDLAAPGEDITVATALDDSWAPEAGTSFSSPLVAGAAAWVWTVRPELDASQLFEVMRRSAVDIDAPGRDDATGLRPPQRPRRARVPGAGARPARAERRHGLRDAGRDRSTTASRPDDEGEAVDDADRAAHGCRGPARRLSRLRPAHGTVTVKVPAAAGVDLGLWTPATQTVLEATPSKDRVATAARSNGTVTVTYKNTGRRGRSTWPSRSQLA